MSERRRSRKQRATPAPRPAEAQKPAPAPEPALRPRQEAEAAPQQQGNQMLQKAIAPRGASAGGAPQHNPNTEAPPQQPASAVRPKPHRRPPSSADSAAPAASEERASDREAALSSQMKSGARTQGHRSIERIVVADDAHDVEPGQMRKTDFLAALEVEVTDAAERELAPSGRSVGDCPWIPYWFAYYQRRDVAQVARALVKFAPEAAGAGSVSAAVAAVRGRVVRSVRQSLALGRPVDTPAGMPAGAFDPSAPAPPPAGPPTADPILNESASQAGSAARASLGLGAGQPLDTATRGRMESVFGADLAHVRVHTDARGQTAAGRTGARAFAYGGDVAFAPGQHQPGTPVGDALLAHELAHTLQQNTNNVSASLALNGASAIEADADRSALGAMGRLWGVPVGSAAGVGSRPTLTSALHVARCGGEAPEITADATVGARKEVDVKPFMIEGSNRNPTDDVAYANTRVFPQANLQLDQQASENISQEDARRLIGENLELNEAERGQSDEEKRLLSRFKSSTVANVVYFGSFEGCSNTTRAEMIHGGGDGMVAMSNASTKTTLPHELGHLMGLDHRNDSDALMTGSGTTDRTVKLNSSEISTIRSSSYAH